jgi:CheY-like chemotaxis protein
MEAQQPATEAHELSGLVVLIVDDEADNLMLLERLLTRRGARVICASSAVEGMALLTQRCPDVLISDLQMPDSDGFGFMQRVRESNDDCARFVPAIAFSSLCGEAHRRRAREAGFWRYFTKPVVASMLCEEVAMLGHAYQRFRRPLG